MLAGTATTRKFQIIHVYVALNVDNCGMYTMAKTVECVHSMAKLWNVHSMTELWNVYIQWI